MMTKTTLVLGQSLFFFAFRTTTIHLPTIKVILKEQTAAGAFGGSRFNRSSTTGNRAFENGFTVAAPIFPFKGCFAFLTSFDGHCFLLQNLKWDSYLRLSGHIIVDKIYIAKRKRDQEEFLVGRASLQPKVEFPFCLFGVTKVQLK